MNLSISVDHRVVDGYDAARFVAEIKATLETPGPLYPEAADATWRLHNGRQRVAQDPGRHGGRRVPVVEAWSDDDHRRATGLGTILSPDGQANRAGVPALAPEALRECYRTMLRIRALDDRARGRAVSEEAGSTGAGRRAAARRRSSGRSPRWRPTTSSFPVGARRARRCGAAIPSRRWPRARPSPRALDVLPGSAHGATQLPHAAGIAWAMKMQATQQAKSAANAGGAGKLALAYLDREATSAEDFHAGLNFAGVFRLPVVFVCINDAPRRTAPVETVSETLAVKALAYGIAGVRVDGSDLFAVFAATRAAVARARSGDGATLIEAVLAEGSDPLPRVRQWLASQDMLDAAAESALRHEVDTEVDVALATPR